MSLNGNTLINLLLIECLNVTVTPPSRPVAPKPAQSVPSGDLTRREPTIRPQDIPPDMDPAMYEAIMSDPELAAELGPVIGGMVPPPKGEPPKLKDFLPYMKPKSFGAKAPSSELFVKNLKAIAFKNVNIGTWRLFNLSFHFSI